MIRTFIWKLILRHFGQVVAQEETSGSLLHSSTQLYEILQHLLSGDLHRLDVHRPNSDQQVPVITLASQNKLYIQSRHNVSTMLNELVQIVQRHIEAGIRNDHFEVSQMRADVQVQREIRSRAQQARSQL